VLTLSGVPDGILDGISGDFGILLARGTSGLVFFDMLA